MVANIRCDNCGLLLALADDPQAPWVTCPRCGEDNFNPAAISRRGAAPLTWTGFLGTMLMLGAIFGWCCGCAGILFEAWRTEHRIVSRHLPPETMGLLQTIAFGCLFVGGILFVRADERRETRPRKLIAAVAASLAALLILTASGMIFLLLSP